MNKNNQHRQSDETLEPYGNDDKQIIEKIRELINHHTPKPQYRRNALIRIKLLLEGIEWPKKKEQG